MNQRAKELIELSQPVLKEVHPHLKKVAEIIISNLADKGAYFGAHMGLRSWKVQDALYAQGRQPLSVVNARRLLAGLGPINEKENSKKITRAPAGKSWHNFATALDLVEDSSPSPGIQWSWDSIKNYLKIGEETKKFPEIVYGGFWSQKDYPHIELHGGLTLEEANRLYSLGGIPRVWEEIDNYLRINNIA